MIAFFSHLNPGYDKIRKEICIEENSSLLLIFSNLNISSTCTKKSLNLFLCALFPFSCTVDHVIS